MNFNQLPGVYDAVTDKLIMDFAVLTSNHFMNVMPIGGTNFRIEKFNDNFTMEKYYLILPDNITEISSYEGFRSNEKIVGISGNNVHSISNYVLSNCKNLEEVNFSNLLFVSEFALTKNPKLEEKCVTKDGLFILNNILISARDYDKDKLIIPENVNKTTWDTFLCCEDLEEIVFPLKMDTCIIGNSGLEGEIILPIEINSFKNLTNKVVYKGTEKHLSELISKDVLDHAEVFLNIRHKPYTLEELKDSNYSLKDIEFILDKKLTLDEILELGKTLKQANDYFKGEEYEL